MYYIKLWTVLLPIVLNAINRQGSVNAKIPVENVRFLLGGSIDRLFGKCVRDTVESLPQEEIDEQTLRKIGIILDENPITEINWHDPHLQCIVRTLIHESGIGATTIGEARTACDFETGESIGEGDEVKDTSENRLDLEGRISNILAAIQSKDRLLDLTYIDNTLTEPSIHTENPSNTWQEEASLSESSDIEPTQHNVRRATVPKKEPSTRLKRYEIDRRIDSLISDSSDEDEMSPGKYATIHLPQSPSKDLTAPKRTMTQSNSLRREQVKAIVVPKRRYRLKLPYDKGPVKTPVRSWIWAKFMQRSLDRTGNVLYFRVPKATGLNADLVIAALKQGKGNFDGYYIAEVGFGRGAPVYHASLYPDPPKNYTFTLVVCLSIVGCIVILCIIYTIHLCRRKLNYTRDLKAQQKHQAAFLTNMEQGSMEKESSKTESWFSKLKRSLQSKIVGKKNSDVQQQQQQRSQVMPEPLRLSFEKTRGQPLNKPSSSRDSKDSVTLDHSQSTDGRKPSRMETKDSLTSRKSSVSSWSSEPVSCGIDTTTGHLILSYMEGYLCDSDRLDMDWNAANSYEAEEATPCADAQRPENLMKNRITAPLPYEQTRVRLRHFENDYINASLLHDHSPRNPIYIATPSPLQETIQDFWEMVWEQNSVVLVCLERTNELKQLSNLSKEEEEAANFAVNSDDSMQYWPNEGSQVFGKFEVHLVSEHSWCDNFVVRSFYLKNLDTTETRTVTQFHYLTWTDEALKTNAKFLLEFRRKVNRSFRGMMSPIIVHCRDGSGRTGTYVLMDLVLNRIAKGVKEINIAATLEHLRDQRQGMVQSKEQYEFVFTAVAQEVDAMLKTTGQAN